MNTDRWAFLRKVEGAVLPPEPIKRTKARRKREKQKQTREVRPYVFARERNICRICRLRAAESMHEIRPKSVGGRVSRRNSIAVCGSGTTGCHGFAQKHQITAFSSDNEGAEGCLVFTVKSVQAAEHCRVKVGHEIVSPVMVETEQD